MDVKSCIEILKKITKEDLIDESLKDIFHNIIVDIKLFLDKKIKEKSLTNEDIKNLFLILRNIENIENIELKRKKTDKKISNLINPFSSANTNIITQTTSASGRSFFINSFFNYNTINDIYNMIVEIIFKIEQEVLFDFLIKNKKEIKYIFNSKKFYKINLKEYYLSKLTEEIEDYSIPFNENYQSFIVLLMSRDLKNIDRYLKKINKEDLRDSVNRIVANKEKNIATMWYKNYLIHEFISDFVSLEPNNIKIKKILNNNDDEKSYINKRKFIFNILDYLEIEHNNKINAKICIDKLNKYNLFEVIIKKRLKPFYEIKKWRNRKIYFKNEKPFKYNDKKSFEFEFDYIKWVLEKNKLIDSNDIQNFIMENNHLYNKEERYLTNEGMDLYELAKMI